jgi:hypothetical protein
MALVKTAGAMACPVAGVTAALSKDGWLLPFALVAATVKVYAVPSVSPVMTTCREDELTVVERLPGDDVTV